LQAITNICVESVVETLNRYDAYLDLEKEKVEKIKLLIFTTQAQDWDMMWAMSGDDGLGVRMYSELNRKLGW
jgi:hypothetical protein